MLPASDPESVISLRRSVENPGSCLLCRPVAARVPLLPELFGGQSCKPGDPADITGPVSFPCTSVNSFSHSVFTDFLNLTAGTKVFQKHRPHHPPWLALLLVCAFTLSSLSSFSSLPSICFSSFQNYLVVPPLSSFLSFSSSCFRFCGSWEVLFTVLHDSPRASP